MATNNITFPIKKSDGTSFYGLVLHNATFDSVVMSLGDKITGDVYYKDNTLAVTMSEYIEYKRNEDSEAVRFVLVNPPTVVREGIVSDNSELRGMTKYSFVFYHPMCAVSNFPFTDVAVSSDEQKYLSNSKTFNWIGNLFDMVAKLNKNLQGTQWIVGTNIEHYEQDGVTETSMWQKAAKIPDEPLSFDKTYVSEVLKTSYETWEIPFVVDQITPTDARYAQGKRFLILFGTPSNEILDDQGEPYIFRFGQGVGLKNNSRTPKNNKIVTRIVGYGSENNIPFGYPQIQWFGDQTWKYTVNNDLSAEGSLPIYKGILGGRYVNLIKHPFTRKTLMPSVYRETLFNKVSPYMSDGTPNPNFDPTIELLDYYDADSSYVNPVVQGAESVEIHQFEDIKPEFTEHSIVGISAYDGIECISISEFNTFIQAKILASNNENEKSALQNVYDNMFGMVDSISNIGGSYTFLCEYGKETEYTSGVWQSVKYTSSGVSFTYNVYNGSQPPSVDVEWDDTMDDDGNYKQSYFKMTLPQLDFDLYACASITEEMKINMRSGACIGCTFDIAVDWDDYKKNFYDSDGNFLPDGEQRDLTKYPKTNLGQVTFVVKKDLDTFGTLMPNTYQQPHSGDGFVILGISLPTTYVTNAEARLDDAAKEYMRENNVHYYEYPLKFDEHFLATHVDILSQIRNNTIVRFQYGAELPMALYVKQITVKYSGVLPTYDITLTDDVEIVLNQIGQVTDDVSRMRVQVSELQKYYSDNIIQAINEKLSKVVDDVCQGRITFQQGLDSIGSAIFHDELRSPDFTSGLYTGRGWRIDNLGNAEVESLRVRSFLEIVELLVNRMQAQEGDTMFSDNDQIDKVDKIEDGGNVSYILSLKEKWGGYVTSQMYGNILKGIINTLAAKQSGVSDVTTNSVYYTSWMRVVDTHNTDGNLGVNQIRVELYNDNETPAEKNFEPCELMTIARWGCEVYNANYSEKYQAEGLATETAARESIKRRQQVFYLSTSDGRIVKLNSVYKPKLEDGNYGTTLGELPEFVKQYSAVAPRLVDGGDYLYAQGIVVGDFIKVDKQGLPLVNYVDKGEWQDNTEYLVNEYNSTTMQYETHDVWHNGSYWRCLVTQPHNGVYYEPTEANNIYWQKLLTSGARGKIGRFFYFAGTFNPQDNDQTHVFEVNDAQAPYFEHIENGQKRYHVFNYDTNGSYTMAQMWAISSNWNNKPWEAMTNDFKYIITEAIFGSYAHFGGAIINGDWMLSQHGTINGVASTSYTNFDPSHPNDNTGTNFIPNYCVDLLTGTVYQQNAFVKGTIEADSGHIGGFIINSTQIKSLNNSIVFNSDGSAVIANGTFTGAINGQVVICGNSNQEGKIYIQPDVYIEEEPGSGIHTAKIRGEFGTLDFHSFELFATQDDAEFILASPTNELNLTENTLRIDTTSFINSITYSTGVFVRVGDYNDNVILRFYKNDGTSLPVSTTQQPPSDVSVGQVYVYQDASNSGQLRIKLSL